MWRFEMNCKAGENMDEVHKIKYAIYSHAIV